MNNPPASSTRPARPRVPSRAGNLRYALQVGKGRFWRTVKAYDAEKYDYELVADVMFRLVCRGVPGHCRILLMPFNVLAESSES